MTRLISWNMKKKLGAAARYRLVFTPVVHLQPITKQNVSFHEQIKFLISVRLSTIGQGILNSYIHLRRQLLPKELKGNEHESRSNAVG